MKNSRDVNIGCDLKREIEHSKFLDNWKSVTPWRLNSHKHLTIVTYYDSLYKYGVSVITGKNRVYSLGIFGKMMTSVLFT